jgi:hypothetical protein
MSNVGFVLVVSLFLDLCVLPLFLLGTRAKNDGNRKAALSFDRAGFICFFGALAGVAYVFYLFS